MTTTKSNKAVPGGKLPATYEAALSELESLVQKMESGQVLHVLATDPNAAKDFQAFAKQTGNALLSSSATDAVFEFFIQRK